MKKILLTIFLFIAFVMPALAEMSVTEVTIKFAQGNDAYKKAQYDQAVQSYEEILKGGRESGPVYFNLANSYFRLGKLGKAIVNYERALQLMPRDSDVRFNERYALSKVKQTEDAQTKTLVEKIITAHVRFYTVGEMVMIIIVLIGLLGVLYIAQLYIKSLKITAPFLALAVIIFLSIFSAGLFLKIEENKNTAIVLQDIQAKFEPRKEATTHFDLYEGSSVKVVSHETGWVKIKRFDGKLGWIENSAIEGLNVQ